MALEDLDSFNNGLSYIFLSAGNFLQILDSINAIGEEGDPGGGKMGGRREKEGGRNITRRGGGGRGGMEVGGKRGKLEERGRKEGERKVWTV